MSAAITAAPSMRVRRFVPPLVAGGFSARAARDCLLMVPPSCPPSLTCLVFHTFAFVRLRQKAPRLDITGVMHADIALQSRQSSNDRDVQTIRIPDAWCPRELGWGSRQMARPYRTPRPRHC
jgi:hypothetical protein